MNVQRHVRIAQIRKLSAYMRHALRAFEYLIYIGFIVAVLMIPAAEGLTLKLGSETVAPDDVTMGQRVVVLGGVSIVLFLTLFVARYMRQLMEQFREGKVFDIDAIRLARKAVNCALALYLFKVLTDVAGIVYSGKIEMPGLALTLLYGFFYFGLVQVILWALEVGRDLSDESELTI
jgi:hypothetical protein